MNEEMEIDLKELWQIIAKRKIMIIVVGILSIAASAAASIFLITPQYQTKSTIVIGKEGASEFYENSYTNSDVMMYQKLVKTYVEISTSKRVISKVADEYSDYSFSALKNMISGAPKSDTQLFTITVKGDNPKDVASIANTTAEIFINEANTYLPAGSLKVLDIANIPSGPVSPNVKLNIMVAFFLGVMVSVGIAFLREYLDTKIKNEDDLERLIDIPVLASIPLDEGC